MLRLTDLREILRYVPRFRDKIFVIAIDGAVVEDEHFGNLLLDIVLLDGDGFDAVINPVITEPVVQGTLYLKVKYEIEQIKAK